MILLPFLSFGKSVTHIERRVGIKVGRAAKQVTGFKMQCSLTVNFIFFSARVYEVEGTV